MVCNFRIIVVLVLLLLSTACTSVQYVTVPVPYLKDFDCPPIVRPIKQSVNAPDMTKEERELARRYNLAATERYVKSLRAHIECTDRNIALLQKEAEQLKKDLETH